MSFQIPAWLDTPPDGLAPAPPVQTREQALPFDRLTWPNFERLILRLVRREKEVIDCAIYGNPGQAQQGLDILAAVAGDPDKRTCYQCKKVQQFGPSEVRESIDAFLGGTWADKTAEFVLCVACPIESTQQQDALDEQRRRLHGLGVKLSLWDGAAGGVLCERLKQLPELVDDFFGRPWVRCFNGDDAATHLGDRLDVGELGALRRKLASLYATVFAQHDPGIRTERGITVNYLDRYVPVDVTERRMPAASHLVRPDSNKASVEESANTSAQTEDREPAQAKMELDIYETRRPVLDWLRNQQHCVVLGEPGYGKSALLRFLALSLLNPETIPNTLSPSHLRRLPVWMSFGRYSSAIEKRSETSVDDFFREWLHQHSFDDLYPLFARALRTSEVLLLADGLDEAVSEEHGREAMERVVAFVQAREAAIICTSRPRRYRSLGVPFPWNTAVLAPLTDEQVQLLATRWFAVAELNAGVDGQVELINTPARPRAEGFLRAIKDNPKTHELARNPLLCHALIELYRFSYRLPEARVVAYEQIIELLLSRHPSARAQAAFAVRREDFALRDSDFKEMLIRIAADIQASEQGGIVSTLRCGEICATFLEDDTEGLGLSKSQARRRAMEAVEQLVTHFGVLVERARGELSFVHLSIQEFLAAESVVRKTETDQLDWMAQNWLKPNWRECLISWFGIQGSRGKKALAGRAVQHLAQLGADGEWQRMQSLELRAEIACSDLGLPVGEARKIVEEVIREVEVSAFPEYRISLARSVTIGALGLPLRDECAAAVARWVPSRPEPTRVGLLQKFRKWQPADDLRSTLLRALHDEDGRCRRAAAESFGTVFGETQDAQGILQSLALHQVRPEVRAAALHGLSLRPDWIEAAAMAADANLGSSNADLLLVVTRIRVRQGRHDDTDLERVRRLWGTDAVGFWFRHELVDVLCEGWPRHDGVRKAFIAGFRQGDSVSRHQSPLEYLLRCYPGDDEVASLLARLLDHYGSHFVPEPDRLWKPMQEGYRGHPQVGGAIRAMLKAHKEKYKAIFWHPRTTPAFIVIGDDEARDELIGSYLAADQRGRYWIATTLINGWSEDTRVLGALQDWSAQAADIAAPLAKWAKLLRPRVPDRHKWLKQMVVEADARIVIDAIERLLDEFADAEAHELVRARLEESGLWYYHRVRVQGLLARAFPNDNESRETLERSLREIDGPNVSDFASSFENDSSVRERLIRAAVPAPAEVRMTVASTLRDRSADLQTVERLTPCVLAEENTAIRSTALMARARAAKNDEAAAQSLADMLVIELSSAGTYYESRHRTALAALVELGQPEKAVTTIAGQKGTGWTSHLVDQLDGDALSLGAIISNWHVLKPLLERHGLGTELPLDEIVFAGYGQLLEQTALSRQALDKYLQQFRPPDWIRPAYLEQLARRFAHSELLRRVLIDTLNVPYSQGTLQCTAARLLADEFSSSDEIVAELSAGLELNKGVQKAVTFGVIGHVVRGWPQVFAELVRATSKDDRAKWLPRDRLLVAAALGEPEEAEEAAQVLLSEPLRNWQYNGEDVEALRLWSEDSSSMLALHRWLASPNVTFSTTALSLLSQGPRSTSLNVEELCRRFNAETTSAESVPSDGLDAVVGYNVAWAIRAYGVISALAQH